MLLPIIVRILSTLCQLNSPVTISYGDGRNKNTKANLDSKVDESNAEHSKVDPVTASRPPQQLQ